MRYNDCKSFDELRFEMQQFNRFFCAFHVDTTSTLAKQSAMIEEMESRELKHRLEQREMLNQLNREIMDLRLALTQRNGKKV